MPLNFLKEYELDYLHDFAKYSNELLENKKGAGNDFLGWVNLPSEALKTFKEIDSIGKEIRENAEVLVPRSNEKQNVRMVYAK